MKELPKIQDQLKAPKNQYNSFGKYHYRNCEDILEALKPLLYKFDCVLTITDTIELIGSRFYVKATATITNKDNVSISTTAYAREEETKKGMDGSQITGASSSYARKYALNGLFLIDDNKDADSEQKEKVSPTMEQAKIKVGEKAFVQLVHRIADKENVTDKLKLLDLDAKQQGIIDDLMQIMNEKPSLSKDEIIKMLENENK